MRVLVTTFALFAAVLSAAPDLHADASPSWRDHARTPASRHLTAVAASSRVQRFQASDAELTRLANTLAGRLRGLFEQAAAEIKKPVPGCDTADAVVRFQRALRTNGLLTDSQNFALVCQSQLRSGQPSLDEILVEGALAAWGRGRLSDAYTLFDAATTGYASSDIHEGAVLQFAAFAFFTQYQNDVESILARHPDLGGRTNDVIGTFELLTGGTPSRTSVAAATAEAERWARSSDRVLAQAGRVYWSGHLGYDLYAMTDSLRFLDQFPDMVSPEEWMDTAFWGAYHQPMPEAMTNARTVYDAVRTFLHRGSWVPLEDNPATYTEIAASVCPTAVLTGADAAALADLANQWLTGADTTANVTASVARLSATSPNKADVLTFEGSLKLAAGDETGAIDKFWAAHQACAYWNLAHSGKRAISTAQRRRGYADSPALAARAAQNAAAAVFPPELEGFVLDWAWLSDTARQQLKESLWFWAPYLKTLYARGERIFIKPAFRLLSQVPTYGSIRDRRVAFSGYDDNRLYDDIGGVNNGTVAVFTVDELESARYYAYNTPAHEVAHGFHHALPADKAACITKLYAAARARNLFADPYASQNEAEYFAQGVGYFLQPADLPGRLGLTRTWLTANDPDLDRFIAQIGTGAAPETFTCPIA